MFEKIFGIARRRKLREVLNILYSLEENSKQFIIYNPRDEWEWNVGWFEYR